MDMGYKSGAAGYNPLGEKSPTLFDNLIWLTTKEAATYLRKSVNAIHVLVYRGQIKARKFSNKLYFKKDELDYLLETSRHKGGS